MLTVKEDAVLNPVTEETAQQKRTKAVRSRRAVLVEIHMMAIYMSRGLRVSGKFTARTTLYLCC
jgi:hypothetical protein